MKMSTKSFGACFLLMYGLLAVNANLNYKEALSKAIIFLDAQRSGKLPPNHRPAWRGDSALQDGQWANVDLVGGYYDAGDNVKFGFPMAFTITTLSWAAVAYKLEIQAAGELENVLCAIRWGTDYLLKASCQPNKLYVQVGDPEKDHHCWVRPEIMKTPRTVLMIDDKNPGSEIAGETSAALAAASMAFCASDPHYATSLLQRAESLFEFAKSHKGTFDGGCPFYCSHSGYNDELLWAATWLHLATGKLRYLRFIKHQTVSAAVCEFNWDLKFAGAQVLLSKLHFKGDKDLEVFKKHADSYICSVLPDSPFHQVFITPGGMIHLRDGANSQYVAGAAYLFAIYSDVLVEFNQKVCCGDKQFEPSRLLAFARQQMDYLLGNNPQGRSYMVGFGKNPPQNPHHRGASMPAIPDHVDFNCGLSFGQYFHNDQDNHHELTGAIVGGPDRSDNFVDRRNASSYTEPCTYINSLAIGALAKLTSPQLPNP